VGSRTPFINNQDYTLFYNDKIYDKGVLVLGTGSLTREVEIEDALVPISKEFRVTKARGNIVLEVDDINATRELVRLVQRSNLSSTALFARLSSGPANSFVTILGGDISKGTLALDCTCDIYPESGLQFYGAIVQSSKAKQPRDNNPALTFQFISDHELDAMPVTDPIQSNCLSVQSHVGVVLGGPYIYGGFAFSNVPHISVTNRFDP
jgi:hypothetical protein